MTSNFPDAIWQKINKGVFIIAEAGKNFITTEAEQPVALYLENAKTLVREAKAAGADAIKFQTHNVEDEQMNIAVESPHARGLDRYRWTLRNTNATPVAEFWKPLKAYCDEQGIVFLSTPFSRGAARRLYDAGATFWKIGSADILDFVMLDYLRNSGLPILMSSGMSTLEEVLQSYNFLRAKNNRVAVMHCLSKYPGLPEEANLAVIKLYKEKFPDAPIGFSENSVGIEPSLIAVALGATIIEKHFTTNRSHWGPDHKVCSTPEEFKTMVSCIRTMEADAGEKKRNLQHAHISAILGAKEKRLKKDEEPLRPLWRKSLVAADNIPAGTLVTADMLYAMRPQVHINGLTSEHYETVIGRRTLRSLKKYDAIDASLLI